MPITITNISENDNMSKSRTDINNNFENLKEGIEDIESAVNPSTGNLSVSNAVFKKGSRSVSTEIVTNEGSERIHGTLSVEGTSTLDDVVITNTSNVTITSGNLNINGANSSVTIEGTTFVDGNIVMKGYGEATLDGSNTGTYTEVTSNVGVLDIIGKSVIKLDFSNYSSSANVENTNDVTEFKIPTGTYQGQVLEILVHAGSSSGSPHTLSSDNIASLTSSESIEFSSDNGHVSLRYMGNSWIITGMFNASKV